MATVTASGALLYSNVFYEAFVGRLNLSTDTIKCAICSSSYTPAQTTHKYKDVSVTAGILTEITLTKTFTSGAVSGKVTTFTATNYSGTATFTGATNLVIYSDTQASNKPLIAYITIPSTDCDGTLQINWNASGIFTVTVG